MLSEAFPCPSPISDLQVIRHMFLSPDPPVAGIPVFISGPAGWSLTVFLGQIAPSYLSFEINAEPNPRTIGKLPSRTQWPNE